MQDVACVKILMESTTQHGLSLKAKGRSTMARNLQDKSFRKNRLNSIFSPMPDTHEYR